MLSAAVGSCRHPSIHLAACSFPHQAGASTSLEINRSPQRIRLRNFPYLAPFLTLFRSPKFNNQAACWLLIRLPAGVPFLPLPTYLPPLPFQPYAALPPIKLNDPPPHHCIVHGTHHCCLTCAKAPGHLGPGESRLLKVTTSFPSCRRFHSASQPASLPACLCCHFKAWHPLLISQETAAERHYTFARSRQRDGGDGTPAPRAWRAASPSS